MEERTTIDEQYITDFTKDWKLESDSGHIELWQFFDKVDWQSNYAIKVGGVVKSVLESEQ